MIDLEPRDLELERKPRIRTSHVRPPIPTTAYDWCAYRDGCEEAGVYGYGATEEAAIADLLAWEDDQ